MVRAAHASEERSSHLLLTDVTVFTILNRLARIGLLTRFLYLCMCRRTYDLDDHLRHVVPSNTRSPL